MRTPPVLPFLLGPLMAYGQLHPPPPEPVEAPREPICGHLRLMRGALAREGIGARLFGPEGLPHGATLDAFGASLRFQRPLSVAEIAALEGITVTGPPVGAVYPATIAWSALDDLRRHPLLLRVEPSWRPIELPPLEVTAAEAGATAVRLNRITGVDGQGVIVATLDSGVDILHPHFFNADAGIYPWIDVDQDGVLTPNRDGVDLDGDGEVGEDERLRVLDGTYVNLYDPAQEIFNEDGRLQPRADWLYVDVNQSGVREAGRETGFSEQDPAYGEPLFVADDVNQDGQITPEERLARLGGSKVLRISYGGRTYYRGGFAGLPLIRAVEDSEHAQSMHGTGVASILLGGQAPYHDRVGLAPGARLITFTNTAMDAYMGYRTAISFLASALEGGATLMLHEWTDPVFSAQDGSSNLEVAMTEARAAGLSQVTPLGNMNHAEKHKEGRLSPSTPNAWAIWLDDGFDDGWQRYPYTVIYASLMWRADQALRLTLRAPSGEGVEIPQDGTAARIGARVSVSGSFDLTPSGTRHVFFYFQDDDEIGLEVGAWTIEINGVEVEDTLFGRVSDAYSGWSVGARWLDFTEDVGTLTYPATADGAFSVAAYGGRHSIPGWEETGAGDLRGYSGRGPRLDGAPAVDIAAPDDPFAALSATRDYLDAGMGPAWFITFGGTSGAGPHVAAALALLRARDPEATAATLEARLLAATREGPATPDEAIGHGKLDVYAALFGAPRPTAPATPPQARLKLWAEAERIYARLEPDEIPDAAWAYRFDLGYDGWDGPWSSAAEVEVERSWLEAGAPLRVAVSNGRAEAGWVYTLSLQDLEVAEDAGADAGRADAGADTGSADTGSADTGSADTGSADTGADRGAINADAPREDGGGCGCALGAAPPQGGWGLVLLFLWGRFFSSRRRG
ncbi:S8 family serine peptidase [Myxococcota bacterium]|nr:S8 family serine peptidase [Myxococcota bacterium]